MDDRKYTYQDLFHIYIETRRKKNVHPDFADYYTELLAHLEHLFRVDFSSPPLEKRALWMLFSSTIDSYLSLRTPWSNYLEAGLLIHKVEQLGQQGERIFALSKQIEDATQSSREAHLQMLDALFVCIYGPQDLIITSQDLRARGFDDAKKPRIEDYW